MGTALVKEDLRAEWNLGLAVVNEVHASWAATIDAYLADHPLTEAKEDRLKACHIGYIGDTRAWLWAPTTSLQCLAVFAGIAGMGAASLTAAYQLEAA